MPQIAFVNLPLDFHFVGVYNSVGHARRVGFLMRQHFINRKKSLISWAVPPIVRHGAVANAVRYCVRLICGCCGDFVGSLCNGLHDYLLCKKAGRITHPLFIAQFPRINQSYFFKSYLRAIASAFAVRNPCAGKPTIATRFWFWQRPHAAQSISSKNVAGHTVMGLPAGVCFDKLESRFLYFCKLSFLCPSVFFRQ
jgi:hypothetical protein